MRCNFEYVPKDAGIVCRDLVSLYKRQVAERGCEYRDEPLMAAHLSAIAGWLCGSKRGLLLIGTCGTGKSVLLRAIMRLLEQYYGKPLRTTYIGRPISCLYNAMELSREAADVPESFAQTCRVRCAVAIDDVGVEPSSVKHYGTEATPLSEFIYARYDRMLPTILATNLTMDELEARYGSRVADRLYEMYDRMVFDFQSFRRR